MLLRFNITLFADDANLHLSHQQPEFLQKLVNAEVKIIDNWMKMNKLTRAVVSRDMSRSRDSLETQFFKVSVSSRSRRCEVSVSVSSRHLEVSENERVSRPLFKVRFKIE